MMAAFLPLLWGASAQAQQVTQTVRLCVEIDIDLYDAQHGDWWTTNGTVMARGVRVRMQDDTGSWWVWMDDHDGCKDVQVTVSRFQTYYWLVRSKALVNGVEIDAYDGEAFDDPSATLLTTSFPVFAFGNSDITLTVSDTNNVWNLLAVGTWAMNRNTFHLGTYSDRGCCHGQVGSPGVAADGTCTPVPPAIPEWYGPWGPATRIGMFNRAGGSSQPDCCPFQAGAPNPLPADPDAWCSGDPTSDYCQCVADDVAFCEAAVSVASNLKFLIAHELGHVLVMKRMGRRTRDANNADLLNCSGDLEPDGTTLVDPGGGSPARGEFTLEYASLAAREGWANFVAAWLWNRRTEADCIWRSWKLHDIDLDGDLDTNSADLAVLDEPEDGQFNCVGARLPSEPDPSDPLDSFVEGYDWLERHYVVAAGSGDCAYFPLATGIDTDLMDRSTAFDWLRFFWDMTRTGGGGVPPADLADIYVDMCPTNWVRDAGGTGDARVEERLEASATHHGYSTEWGLWKLNGQDR